MVGKVLNFSTLPIFVFIGSIVIVCCCFIIACELFVTFLLLHYLCISNHMTYERNP